MPGGKGTGNYTNYSYNSLSELQTAAYAAGRQKAKSKGKVDGFQLDTFASQWVEGLNLNNIPDGRQEGKSSYKEGYTSVSG